MAFTVLPTNYADAKSEILASRVTITTLMTEKKQLRTTVAELTKQRDELLAALSEALECGEDGDWQSARRTIEAAIASVKEQGK